MKGNKGITLIALIVTIIVLIILAGVAIAMLTDDNGILNSAGQARYDNIIGSVSEQVGLAALSLKTTITRDMLANENYIAASSTLPTAEPTYAAAANTNGNFAALVEEVRADLGAHPEQTISSSTILDGFYVTGQLNLEGTDTVDGEGYILIAYSDNSLRSSLPSNAGSSGTFKSGTTTLTVAQKTKNLGSDAATNPEVDAAITKNANQAAIVYVIKVTNYGSTLSNAVLTDTTNVAEAFTWVADSDLGSGYNKGFKKLQTITGPVVANSKLSAPTVVKF